jgi:hypothetical protein
MKNILKVLLFAVVLFSCQPDEIPPIGDKTDYKPMLAGTWKLVKFEQIDADAQSKDFPEFAAVKDLTTVFPGKPYTDFSITFKADGTFTSNKGNSYVQMLGSGSWSLDSQEFPSAIILTNGSVSQTVSLGSLADVIVGKLEFEEVRKQKDTGKVKIQYIYSLIKI